MKSADVDEFFKRLAKQRPTPKVELDYTNPYTLMVAAVLSAQATDVGVNKATKALFEKVSTPQAMLALGEGKLKEHVKSIGLYNAKVKNIMAFSQILVDRFKGDVPQNLDDLVSLPGVGRKTANVVLNTAFHQPVIAVDTHVFRVSNRTGLAPGKDPVEVETKLMEVVPDKWKLNASHWLVLHGRYTCVARKPKCPECVVRDLCAFKDKTL